MLWFGGGGKWKPKNDYKFSGLGEKGSDHCVKEYGKERKNRRIHWFKAIRPIMWWNKSSVLERVFERKNLTFWLRSSVKWSTNGRVEDDSRTNKQPQKEAYFVFSVHQCRLSLKQSKTKEINLHVHFSIDKHR